ncbi:hypothetical protein HLBS07_03640 [Vibrio alginolyticus]|nr:hypothetical protein HLBS07_03640 [Vibrio alginolyticus]
MFELLLEASKTQTITLSNEMKMLPKIEMSVGLFLYSIFNLPDLCICHVIGYAFYLRLAEE